MSVFSKIYKDSADMVKHIQKYDKTAIKNYFVNIYSSIACNSFRWEGVPDNYIKNWIEIIAYDYPIIGAFIENNELKIFPATPNGTLLENGLYSNYIMIPPIGKPYIKPLDEVELLFNNSSLTPTSCIIEPIINHIVNTYLSISNNVTRAEVGGFIVAKDATQVKLIEDAVLNTKIENGIVKVILNDSFTSDDITYIPIFDNSKTDIKTLWESFDKNLSLLESNMGFLTTEIFKKERLTEAESISGYDSIQYGFIDDMYEHRKEWVNRVNKHFNKELSVELVRSYIDKYSVKFASDFNRNINIERGDISE